MKKQEKVLGIFGYFLEKEGENEEHCSIILY